MLLSINHQKHRSQKNHEKSTRESTIVRRWWRVDAQTEHMQDGGKKDASYIARLFEEEVNKFDPKRSCTDVFALPHAEKR